MKTNSILHLGTILLLIPFGFTLNAWAEPPWGCETKVSGIICDICEMPPWR